MKNEVDFDKYPNAPGHRGVKTSVEAADHIAPAVRGIRKQTLDAYIDRGPMGYTADEVALALDRERWELRPRVTELQRLRLLADSGMKRRNQSGRSAIVWIAAQYLAENEALTQPQGRA